MDFSVIFGMLIRHALTTAGGYLVAKGVVDTDTATQLVGAGATLAGLALSAVQKHTSGVLKKD